MNELSQLLGQFTGFLAESLTKFFLRQDFGKATIGNSSITDPAVREFLPVTDPLRGSRLDERFDCVSQNGIFLRVLEPFGLSQAVFDPSKQVVFVPFSRNSF